MVNGREKEEFSRRLKEALSRISKEPMGAVRLQKEFNRRHTGEDMSVQGVQKWLSGDSIPRGPKLRTLAAWLDVSMAWLRDGEGKESDGLAAHDAAAGGYRIHISEDEMVKRYRRLDERQQQVVAEIVTALAAKDTHR